MPLYDVFLGHASADKPAMERLGHRPIELRGKQLEHRLLWREHGALRPERSMLRPERAALGPERTVLGLERSVLASERFVLGLQRTVLGEERRTLGPERSFLPRATKRVWQSAEIPHTGCAHPRVPATSLGRSGIQKLSTRIV